MTRASRDRDRCEAAADWEIPLSRDLVGHVETHGSAFRPRRFDAAPPEAVETLTELVGVEDPLDLLVVPSVTRAVRRGYVYTPTQVLGVGRRGVGLWIDDLRHGRVAALAYPTVVAVDHVVSAPRGRLTVFGGDIRLALTYDLAGWPLLHPLLARVRANIAPAALAVPVGSDASLAPPWRRILDGLVRRTAGEPVAWVFSGCRRTRQGRRRRGWPAALAALTPHELVLARAGNDAPDVRHGVNLLAVPRARLELLSASDGRLAVTVERAEHGVDVGPDLAEAVARHLVPLTVTAPGAGPVGLDPQPREVG